MNQESEITKEQLERWARSMAGCDHDNGDASAKVWICGIEPGGSKKADELGKEIKTKKKKDWDPTGHFSWPETMIKREMKFLHKIAHTYAEYLQADLDPNQLGKDDRKSDNNIFKLNLYPAAVARDTQEEWEKSGLDKLLGFDKKRDYKQWCKDYRFPYFADLRKKYNPELILCFGRQSEEHFKKFVGSNDGNDSDACNTKTLPKITPSNLGGPSRLRDFEVNLIDGKTLFVCHAFPTYLSHKYLKALGKKLRELRKELGLSQ